MCILAQMSPRRNRSAGLVACPRKRMNGPLPSVPECELDGLPVALVGRPAAVTFRQWVGLLQRQGAVLVPPEEAKLIVVGEGDLPLDFGHEAQDAAGVLSPEVQARAERGQVEAILETELWRRLGLLEQQHAVQRLFTAASLAALLRVPVGVIRRWVRAGLIEPVRVVRRLALFDYQQVHSARRLAQWMHQGVPPRRIQEQLLAWQKLLPGWRRPLAQLEVLVRGRELLLRQGQGLVDSRGQRYFDFAATVPPAVPPVLESHDKPHVLPFTAAKGQPPAADAPTAEQDPAVPWLAQAESLEDQGRWAEAVACYRQALRHGGPDPELCFRLAELLYMLGYLEAAAERYQIALELEPEHLEARLNLGCLLAELKRWPEAETELRRVLELEDRLPDAHYHLARVLEQQHRTDEAQIHLRRFLQLAPHSPWAQEAQRRLHPGG